MGIKAIKIPFISKNKWNNKILKVIGTNKIAPNAENLFNKNIKPDKTKITDIT